jgi:hypothetical protein
LCEKRYAEWEACEEEEEKKRLEKGGGSTLEKLKSRIPKQIRTKRDGHGNRDRQLLLQSVFLGRVSWAEEANQGYYLQMISQTGPRLEGKHRSGNPTKLSDNGEELLTMIGCTMPHRGAVYTKLATSYKDITRLF